MIEEVEMLLSARDFVQHALKQERLPSRVRQDLLTVNAKIEYVVAKLQQASEAKL